MFVPAEMRRVDIFLLESDVEAATTALARFAELEIETTHAEGWKQSARWTELADRYGDQLQRASRLLAVLGIEAAPGRPPPTIVPSRQADSLADELHQFETMTADWEQRRRHADKELETAALLTAETRQLLPIAAPIEEVRGSRHLAWLVGTLPREAVVAPTAPLAPEREPGAPQRLRAFVLTDDVEAAIATLLAFPGTTVVRARRAGAEPSPFRELAERYADLAQRMSEVMEALDLDRPPRRAPERYAPRRDGPELQRIVERVEAEVNAWRRRQRDAEEQRREIADSLARVQAIAAIAFPLAELRGLDRLWWAIGTIDRRNLDHLRVRLAQIPVVIAPLGASGDDMLVWAAAPSEHAGIVERALAGLLAAISLPERVDDRPEQAAPGLERTLASAQERLAALADERRRLRDRDRSVLAGTWQRLASDLEAAQTIAELPHRDGVYSVELETTRIEELLLALEEATAGRAEAEILRPRRRRRTPAASQPWVEAVLFKVPFVVMPLADAGDDRILVVASTPRRHAEVLEQALGGLFFKELELPADLQGKPSAIMPELERREANARARLAELDRQRRSLASSLDARVAALAQRISAGLTIARAISMFPVDRDLFLISGWTPADRLGELILRLETATEGRADVQVIEPERAGRRAPPTRLDNPRPLRVFEPVVHTFGEPSYGEIDPTPLAALSFPLMYGMMFGDLGHGLVFALLGVLLWKRSAGTTRALGALAAVSGVSAAGFGLLYGSAFGVVNAVPGHPLSPLGGAVALLLVSVLGGVILMGVAFVLSLVNLARARRWGDFLFAPGGVAGVLLYAALVGGGYAVYEGALPFGWMVVMVAAPLVVLFLREPLARLVYRRSPPIPRSLGMFVVLAFFEVFETGVSYVSNTLSFLRLGAFGIAHAALMEMVFGSADAAGGAWRWLIIIIGTVIVLALEGLVVAIQALRLEYYEIFGKFFRGTGRAFAPLSLGGEMT